MTQALIERNIAEDRLILIESNEYFYDMLRCKFPAARIILGDGFQFEHKLDRKNQIAGVVSGLPLLNFAPSQRRSLIDRAIRIQGPTGRFIQLSYGWRPAVPPGPRLHVKRSVVWSNFPPACIWIYSTSRPI